jgi:hypothetical protein
VEGFGVSVLCITTLQYFTLQECSVPDLEKEERIRLIKSCPV